jgi:hypothetical protein
MVGVALGRITRVGVADGGIGVGVSAATVGVRVAALGSGVSVAAGWLVGVATVTGVAGAAVGVAGADGGVIGTVGVFTRGVPVLGVPVSAAGVTGAGVSFRHPPRDTRSKPPRMLSKRARIRWGATSINNTSRIKFVGACARTMPIYRKARD